MLGYVPRRNNTVIARLMDIGKEFYAVLSPFEPDGGQENDLHYKMYAKIFMRE